MLGVFVSCRAHSEKSEHLRLFFTAKQQQNRTLSQLGTESSFSALCEGEILQSGSEFAYGYDETGRVTAITHSTEDGEENANNTAYTCGCATDVKSGNNVVRYTYDGKRRVTAVELNGVENYVTYAYEDVTVDK